MYHSYNLHPNMKTLSYQNHVIIIIIIMETNYPSTYNRFHNTSVLFNFVLIIFVCSAFKYLYTLIFYLYQFFPSSPLQFYNLIFSYLIQFRWNLIGVDSKIFISELIHYKLLCLLYVVLVLILMFSVIVHYCISLFLHQF